MGSGDKQKQDMKRRPIRLQVQRMVLLLCVAALVVTGMLWAGSLFALRDTVQRDSRDLGENAATAGSEALLDQMEHNLLRAAQVEAEMADRRFIKFADYTSQFAFYARRIYEEPDAYVPRKVYQVGEKSNYHYVLLMSFANASVALKDVEEEMDLLSNLVHVWQPVITDNDSIISTIYIATESGFMLTYESTPNVTSEYYDYFDSIWYTAARNADGPVFTGTYEDHFGRGLTVTCAAPVRDAEGRLAGVVCIDILVENIIKEIIDIDFSPGSYAFLVDPQGDIIASPYMREDGSFDNVWSPDCPAYEAASQIMSGVTGVTSTSDDIYYAYTPITTADWTLAIHAPADAVLTPVEDIRADITARTDATAATINARIARTEILSLAVFALIIGGVVGLSGGFSRRLTGPLLELRSDVEHISSGDLTHQAAVRQNDEIGDLAVAFNGMAGSLNSYIRDLTNVTAEKERIGAELDIATHIQASMLPCIFPPFPDRKEFSIFASMAPAKEVGGDFYDFFMVDDTHLAVVMADVSGKGVPAALFMVIGKTLIKDHTTPGRDLGEVFMEVNRLLCESNSEEMFITAFEGVLDLETGRFDFVNAGHEMPFICKKDGSYAPYKIRPGFVLAGMEGTRYRMGSMELEPGDKLFQYTDGVTEATNGSNELYGMERLEAVLNRNAEVSPDELLPAVKADIDRFVGEAPQFDDITMLCLEFREKTGTGEPDELTVEATLENIPAVTDFVNERLEALDCPMKAQTQIDIAIDELFGNIAHYAYDPDTGPATVRVDVDQEPLAVRITFIDQGRPYDPLAKTDPDVSLSAEDRQIGGLGIFMVKKTMDDVKYEYKDGQNILTIKKSLEA